MSTRERKTFSILASFAFAYIAARAFFVPLTHDEARTFFVYTLSGEFLPWLSHWDAGNHVVCTALGWVSYKLFGMAPFALRSFTVLSFALYAWYAWRMGAWVRDAVVRWSLWSALLLAPVLIEFFAMYRGYGMGIAFLLMALFHTTEAQRGTAGRHIVMALLAWMLAAWAMLSLALLWYAALLVLALVLVKWKGSSRERSWSWGAWVLLGLLPAAAAAAYGHELSTRGLLYYGTPNGIVDGTVRSLTMMLFGVEDDPVRWSLFAVGVAALYGAVALVFQRPKELRQEPLTLLVLLFLLELLGRSVLGEALGVLYPSGRTALHWLPVMTLLVALVVDRLALKHAAYRFAALLLVVFPLRTLVMANVSYTSIWPEEAISANLFDRAARVQRGAGRPLLIGAYNQMPPQWDHERLRHYPMLGPITATEFPNANCDLLLIDTTYFPTPPGFTTIATSASGRQVLKQRQASLALTLLHDTVLSPSPLVDEFRTLWEPAVPGVLGMELVLDLEMVLRSDAECLMTELVVEVDGATGEHLHYDAIQLRYLQREWDGDTLRLLRRIPLLAGDTKRVVCYLWDQRRQHPGVEHMRLRTLRIPTDHDLRNP